MWLSSVRAALLQGKASWGADQGQEVPAAVIPQFLLGLDMLNLSISEVSEEGIKKAHC